MTTSHIAPAKLRAMPQITITEVTDSPDLDAVRGLCREFRTWLYERYPGDHDLIDAYYNPEDFERLLSELDVIHAPPDGLILLARVDGGPAGCVMMKKFSDGICEMKRMYVAAAHRGLGLGVTLGEALLGAAAKAGYRTMRLDTGPFHHEAKALYVKLGFTPRDAYYDPGPQWRDKLVYMERDLSETGAQSC